ncbi:MAG: hypothetical protein ACYS26_10535 [Planctomycetota bacterium]
MIQVHARTEAPLLEDPGFDEEGNPLPQVIPDQYVGPLSIEPGGGLLFLGATDGQGRLQAPVFAPTAIEWFDVVVSRNGATGPLTDSEWLAAAGPFNVASRTTWSAAGLRTVRIELQEGQL